MTVPSETCFNLLNWTGVETTFATGIQVMEAADLLVTHIDGSTDARTLLVQGTHYSVSLSPTNVATVTRISFPPAAGQIEFMRDTDMIQPVNFEDLAHYSAEVHETLFDTAFMGIAEAKFLANDALDPPAVTVVFTPTGSLVATNVQAAIEELDADAFRKSVPGEIAALPVKTAPTAGDFILIEDSAAGYAKKRAAIVSLNAAINVAFTPSGSIVAFNVQTAIEELDLDAFKKSAAGEIAALTLKPTPDGADHVLIEDSLAGNVKRRVPFSAFVSAGGTTDADAFHKSTAGEIAALSSKPSPVAGDHVLIEDSAAGNVKKRVPASAFLTPSSMAAVNVTFSPTGSIAAIDVQAAIAELDLDAFRKSQAGEIAGLTQKATPVGADHVLIEDSAAGNAKKRVTMSAILVAANVSFAPTGSIAATTVQAAIAELDLDAFRKSVNGEIAALTQKATPAGTDHLLIEDGAASNAKKRATIFSILVAGNTSFTPSGSIVAADVQGAIMELDLDAFKKSALGEIQGLTEKAAPAAGDYLLLEDSAASFAKKRVPFSAFGGASTDGDAFHKSVAAEISALTQKVTPVAGDHLLIEDSAAGNVKKRVTVSGLLVASRVSFSATGSIAATDVQAAIAELDLDAFRKSVNGEIAALTQKTTPTGADHLLIEDAAASNAKKRVLLSFLLAAANHPFTAGGSIVATNVQDAIEELDLDAFRKSQSGEIAALTQKVTPTGSDHLLIEDAAASNAKKRILISSLPASTPSDASTTVKGISEFATAAEYRTGTDTGRSLVVSEVWASGAEVTLTDAATIAVDMATFINAVVTLAGNRAMGNPTNEKPGQAGVIRIVQDGTGNRTLTFGTDWEFAGGVAPVLSNGASSQDLLFYHVIAANRVYGSLAKNVS
jgi:hypothetical protein